MIPAVVITFNPDVAWARRLASVHREHARVVVVDNSTSTEAMNHVASVIKTTPGASLLSLPNNPGIGTALNLGFSTLAAEGYSCAVAYDQDSTPAEGFAAALSATAAANPRAAVVGANWNDPRRPGRPARFLRPALPLRLGFRRVPADRDLSGLLCVITSGSWFDLSVWNEIDGFCDDLFLDLVDTDYCLRARRAGRDIAASAGACLLHHRGEKKPVRFLRRDFYPAHTPPFRLYCLSRNRILLFRRHRLRPIAWLAYEIAYAAKLAMDAMVFEQSGISRLLACARGTWDGILGRAGPVRPPHDRGATS